LKPCIQPKRAPDGIVFTEHRFISFDGTPVYYSKNSPEQCKAILIVIHGMGEHGGRYQVLANTLALDGIESVCPDLRGYGKSGGKRGHANTISDFYRDLESLHSFLERSSPGKPIFMLGHSFGGLLAAGYVSLFSKKIISGLILSSPLFGIYGKIAWWRHGLFLLLARLLPQHIEKTRVNANFLTHDKAIAQGYKKDALVHYDISAKLYAEILHSMSLSEAMADKLKTPLLFLQAGDDRIVRKEAGLCFYSKAASKDKTLQVFDAYYHEVLNEIGKEEIMKKISQWVWSRL
jgi:alpha-beta hydrolase superfamily lysophospholipase